MLRLLRIIIRVLREVLVCMMNCYIYKCNDINNLSIFILTTSEWVSMFSLLVIYEKKFQKEWVLFV